MAELLGGAPYAHPPPLPWYVYIVNQLWGSSPNGFFRRIMVSISADYHFLWMESTPSKMTVGNLAMRKFPLMIVKILVQLMKRKTGNYRRGFIVFFLTLIH